MVISLKIQINQIRAEDFGVAELVTGEVEVVAGIWGIQVEGVVDLEEEEGDEEERPISIPWLVTGAGCVATWPVTVLALGHNC